MTHMNKLLYLIDIGLMETVDIFTVKYNIPSFAKGSWVGYTNRTRWIRTELLRMQIIQEIKNDENKY